MPAPVSIGLIIFDCDGVLVDSEIIAHRLLAQMMTELGHPTTTAESIQKFAGRSLADILPLIEATLGGSLPDHLGQRYGDLLLECLRRETGSRCEGSDCGTALLALRGLVVIARTNPPVAGCNWPDALLRREYL
jgi:hypothetical protein